MKYLILIGLVWGSASLLLSQTIQRSVIGSSGHSVEAGGLQVSSTVGEAVIGSVSAGSIVLTQGFQQPDAGQTSSLDRPGLAVAYRVYPNPTPAVLHLQLSSERALSLELALFDQQGRALSFHEKLTVQGSISRTWNLQGLSEGIYQLRLIEAGGRVVQTLRIQKLP